MAEITYTTVPGKVKPLLTKIREVGVPSKVTLQWLKTVGFTSSNDASLLGVLKVIGLIDATGVPTSRWSLYRGAEHKKILGDAITQGYADLFAVYPNAQQRPAADLEHVFSTSSSSGKQVISKAVSTFKSLCELAEFAPVSEQTNLQMHTGPMHAPVSPAPSMANVPTAQSRSGPSVHIDVQIHIAPEATADQIDQIFKSMAKHLYGAKGAE